MVRFADLRAAGIVDNRMTLARWTATLGFPKPIDLGKNTLAWYQDEIESWIVGRKADREAEAARKAKGALATAGRAAGKAA